jgi:hypothetical protein
MATLLACDPGLRNPAAAWFVNGVLQKASRVKVKVNTKEQIAKRCRDIALAVAYWCPSSPDQIIVEWPQIYTQDKSKGDPNNLVPLAGVGACLVGLFPDSSILSPRPRDWTGNIPKAEDGDPWASPRGKRVWDRLTPAERLTVVPSHDAVDAVGIGLWALGRFERRRVFSRS